MSKISKLQDLKFPKYVTLKTLKTKNLKLECKISSSQNLKLTMCILQNPIFTTY